MMIEEALATDADALVEFLVRINGERHQALARQAVGSLFACEAYHPTFVVAKEGGAILGAAACSEEIFTVGTWGISWVSVDPRQRRQGLGQQLVEYCFKKISEQAQKTVTVLLATYPNKTELYDRLGFTKAIQDHEGGWYMTKTLLFKGGHVPD